MANNIITSRIQQRHDTAAHWTATNPILLIGEIGLETDTKNFKFGDGTTAWNSLGYAESHLRAEIVNDLTTGGTAVPLSAEMGKRLNARWGGNSLLLVGTITITTPGASPNRASATVTFPTAFAEGTTPRVALATTGSVGPVSRQASVGAISNTSMTVYVEYTTNTTSVVAIPVSYIVVGEGSET